MSFLDSKLWRIVDAWEAPAIDPVVAILNRARASAQCARDHGDIDPDSAFERSLSRALRSYDNVSAMKIR